MLTCQNVYKTNGEVWGEIPHKKIGHHCGTTKAYQTYVIFCSFRFPSEGGRIPTIEKPIEQTNKIETKNLSKSFFGVLFSQFPFQNPSLFYRCWAISFYYPNCFRRKHFTNNQNNETKQQLDHQGPFWTKQTNETPFLTLVVFLSQRHQRNRKKNKHLRHTWNSKTTCMHRITNQNEININPNTLRKDTCIDCLQHAYLWPCESRI